MMETKEELYQFLPRHIRKLIQYKEKTPQPYYPQKEGWLDMESTASVYKSIGNPTQSYHQYPDPNATKLREQLASEHQLDSNQICVGNGSSELIDLLIRSFCTPNQDKVLAFSPVASRLQNLARLQAINVELLPLELDKQLPLLSEKNYTEPKVIFIENPNTIIGSPVSSFDVADIVNKFEGIVIVDESAIDYTPEDSLISLIHDCPNLIVIQSFSGVWGLAGLRIGAAFAQPEIIKVLNLIKPAYSVNTIAQKAAVNALYFANKKENIIAQVVKQRRQLKSSLQKMEMIKKVHDSTTNTLLVEVENAKELVDYLRTEELIIVLDVSNQVGIENCVRISVRQGLENVRLLNALKDMKYNQSKTRQLLRSVTNNLRKASSFFGVFKKVFGV